MFHLLINALLASGAATAEPELTVEAERLTEQQIEDRSRSFVRGVLPPPSYGQYARWAQPVCMKVSGIADVYADMVGARVRSAAADAGVPMGRPGCRTNLSIVFSEDARLTTGIIARRKPRQVARLDGVQLDRLLKADLPVRWWHIFDPTDGSSVPAGTMAPALMTASSEGGQSLAQTLAVGPDTIMTSGYSSSLIDTNLKLGVTSAVVVVDIPRTTGKPLDAVADYVALVALAPARLPPEQPGVPSILSLFASGPATLTVWDKAYLAALYRMQLNRRASLQRGQLVSGMTAAFKPAK